MDSGPRSAAAARAAAASETELDRYLALADGLQRMIAALLAPLNARAERFASAIGKSVRGRVYLQRGWLDAEGIDHMRSLSTAWRVARQHCRTP